MPLYYYDDYDDYDGNPPAVLGGFSHPLRAPAAPPTTDERRLDLELDAGTRRLTLLERDHRALQRDHVQLVERLAQVERRLDTLVAAQTAGREDLPSNDHGEHHVIAREYDAFVEQRVQGLARAVQVRPDNGVPDGVQPTPWLMSRICAVLFGAADPDTGAVLAAVGCGRLDVLAPQAARLVTAALELRGRSDATGLPYAWDAELTPGEPLDEEWQQAWPACDRSQPGQFVIAPAYTVAEQIYSLQWVYTGASFGV